MIFPPALPNDHYCVVWHTHLVLSTIFSLSVPSTLFMSAQLSTRCGILSFAWLCHIYESKRYDFCSETHRCYGNYRTFLTECSLNDQLCYVFFCSWTLVCWKLHISLMAHSTPYSPHSDPVCDSLRLSAPKKLASKTSRWPLQSGPWCYLLITTCHPSTGTPLRRRSTDKPVLSIKHWQRWTERWTFSVKTM